VRVLKRHSGGGNILHFDGSIFLAKNPEQLRIAYWEPDYQNWAPVE
jgi:prepilin-type processing-associated H-X9-DG protein